VVVVVGGLEGGEGGRLGVFVCGLLEGWVCAGGFGGRWRGR